MKLFRRKFLILTLICCIGMQPVILTNGDLSFGQRYLLDRARDPQLANSEMILLYLNDFIFTLWVALLVVKWVEKNKQVVIKVQNGPGQPIYDVSVDAELAKRIMQKKDTQIEQQKVSE